MQPIEKWYGRFAAIVTTRLFPPLLFAVACAPSCRGDEAREEPGPALATRAADRPDPAPAPPPIPAFAEGDDEREALEREGALPAWEAVVRRHRLLARRERRGAVYGRFAVRAGAPWLVDETEGEGALAIRLDLSKLETEAPEPGARLVAWGAWRAGDGRWLWRARRPARLAPAAEAIPAASPLEVARVGGPPEGATPVSEAEGAGTILFAVLEAPVRVGDGWVIADDPGAEPAARLLLPGERRPYGGQALFAGEERWDLEVGGRYAARVGRFRRPRRDGAIPTLRAEAAPVTWSAGDRESF